MNHLLGEETAVLQLVHGLGRLLVDSAGWLSGAGLVGDMAETSGWVGSIGWLVELVELFAWIGGFKRLETWVK